VTTWTATVATVTWTSVDDPSVTWVVNTGPVTVTGGGPPSGGAGGFLSGAYPNPGVDTEALQDAVGAMAGTGLTYDDAAGVINAAGGGVTDHGALTGLGDDDHTQYQTVGVELVTGSRSLTGLPGVVVVASPSPVTVTFPATATVNAGRAWSVSVADGGPAATLDGVNGSPTVEAGLTAQVISDGSVWALLSVTPTRFPNGSANGDVPVWNATQGRWESAGVGAPAAHKTTHAVGGTDALTPADIGAQPSDADLTAIAALSTTGYGRALLALADLPALRTVLGSGTPSGTTFLRGDGAWSAPAGSAPTRLTFSNADYTIVTTAALTVASQTGTLTAARTVTLPAASTVPAGGEVVVQAGLGCSLTNTLSVARAGADTLNGAATSVVIAAAYAWRRFVSDGTSAWTLDVGIVRASNNLSDLQSATTARTNLGIASPPVGNIRMLASRPSPRGWAFWVGGTTITPQAARACASLPFTVNSTSTLAELAIECVAGAASGSHLLALYAAGTNGEPTTLITSFSAFGCTTSGTKTLTGLSASLVVGSNYVLVSTPAAGLHTLRGVNSATSGLAIANGWITTEISTIGTGGDNLQRGQGWFYTPAVSGVFDATPTWIMTTSSLTIPNIGLTIT